MIALIFWIVYGIGYVVFLYPTYFHLLLAKRRSDPYDLIYDLKASLPPLAAVVNLLWFIALPFYASYWLHNRGVLDFNEIERKAVDYEKRQRHYEQIKASADRDHEKLVQAAIRELDKLT